MFLRFLLSVSRNCCALPRQTNKAYSRPDGWEEKQQSRKGKPLEQPHRSGISRTCAEAATFWTYVSSDADLFGEPSPHEQFAEFRELATTWFREKYSALGSIIASGRHPPLPTIPIPDAPWTDATDPLGLKRLELTTM